MKWWGNFVPLFLVVLSMMPHDLLPKPSESNYWLGIFSLWITWDSAWRIKDEN